MTDIVDRLRDVFPIGWEGEMRHKAADEIERLRKDNEGLLSLVDVTRDSATGHQERAEMLRTALRDLVAELSGAGDAWRWAHILPRVRAALTEAGYG